AGWREALDNYQARINDAKAGHLEGTVIRADTKVSGRFTVKDLCNEFRTSKKLQLDAGDIGQRMYEEYKNICDLLHAQFGNRTVAGLQPKDFEVLRAHMAQRWGPTRLGNAVVYVR